MRLARGYIFGGLCDRESASHHRAGRRPHRKKIWITRCTNIRRSRPGRTWPNGARIAFYVGLNIEHFEVDKPSTSIYGGTAALVPDPLNFGWRDYGVRVGIWRMIEALDNCKMRASVLLNSDCCAHYPEIIDAGKKRDWAWLAHGKNNST